MSFLLAHLTDAHIGPLPQPSLRELTGKRALGYVNWRRQRHRAHDMDLLRRLVADLHRQRGDHVAMTGDILNIGLPAEYPLAAAWLETLGSADAVSFTPGNHDAYMRDSMPHLAATFAPWVTSDAAPTGRGLSFPYLRRRGDVALIGLCSGAPSGLLMATGRLGPDQLARLATLLKETRGEPVARVVMIHHPPLFAGASTLRRLTDARALEKVLSQEGAELVIHGHNHVASIAYLNSSASKAIGGRIPIIGAPSASSISRAPRSHAAYHLLRLEKAGGDWRVFGHARGPLAGSRDIGELREINP
jgi:3',5'-cyclic AMP phosphodiesterase CpdA